MRNEICLCRYRFNISRLEIIFQNCYFRFKFEVFWKETNNTPKVWKLSQCPASLVCICEQVDMMITISYFLLTQEIKSDIFIICMLYASICLNNLTWSIKPFSTVINIHVIQHMLEIFLYKYFEIFIQMFSFKGSYGPCFAVPFPDPTCFL